MPGRKPTPTHLKIVKGNPGKRPLNKNEPTFDQDLPEPPSYLSTEAQGVFVVLRDRLQAMGYASASHTEALSLCALRLEEVWRCTTIINNLGLTYVKKRKLDEVDEEGNPVIEITYKTRPEVNIRHEAAKHAQSLLAEFGLTPASATKVVVPDKPKGNAFSAL